MLLDFTVTYQIEVAGKSKHLNLELCALTAIISTVMIAGQKASKAATDVKQVIISIWLTKDATTAMTTKLHSNVQLAQEGTIALNVILVID